MAEYGSETTFATNKTDSFVVDLEWACVETEDTTGTDVLVVFSTLVKVGTGIEEASEVTA